MDLRPFEDRFRRSTGHSREVHSDGHVLIVEDEDDLRMTLCAQLRDHGYSVSEASTPDEAKESARNQRPDLVLLDRMFRVGNPGNPHTCDAIELIQPLRALGNVAIVILTARDSQGDRQTGLAAGADDYVCKPFSMTELMDRVTRALRARNLPHGGAVYDDGIVCVNFDHKLVHVNSIALDLRPQEYRLLAMLVSPPGQPHSDHAVCAAVQPDQDPVRMPSNTAAVAAFRLRRKLQNAGLDRNVIVNARGVGYYYRPPDNLLASPNDASTARREADLLGVGYSHGAAILERLNEADRRAAIPHPGTASSRTEQKE